MGEDAAVILRIPQGRSGGPQVWLGRPSGRLPVGGTLEVNLDREVLGQGFLLEGDPQALGEQLPRRWVLCLSWSLPALTDQALGTLIIFKVPTEVWTESETRCGLILPFTSLH